MSKLTEKELLEQYKNLKMMDTPAMWDDIERNLAPKKVSAGQEDSGQTAEGRAAAFRKKQVVSFRRWVSFAAVVLAVLVIGPVVYFIGTNQSKGMDDSSKGTADFANSNESVNQAAADSAPQGEDQSGGQSEADGRENTAEQETDSAKQETASAEQETAPAEQESVPTEKAPGEAKAEKDQVASQEIGQIVQMTAEIQSVDQQADSPGYRIIAKVAGYQETGQGAGDYLPGEIITFFYEGTGYQEADFIGTLRLKLQRTEKNLKLLEILP